MVKPRLMVCRAIGMATGLYATVAGGAEPVAAQETGYRVVLEARYRAALVVPEIVCRDAPSQSADAAGRLTVGGDGWASEFLVGRTERDEAGERWIHVGPGHTGRYGMPDGCWVPESAVAPTEKAGHLLQLADGLLSTAAWPPLEHFVAAHNLFVHPRYRERVQESPVLGQRRLDLLAKAVEAAQSEQGGVPRPVDRNPLVLAWLEALGEQVRYSEDRWGRGAWTVSEDTLNADVGPAGPPQPEPTTPNEGGELAVIAPDVVCRPRPSRTALGSIVLPVDFHFRTGRADTSVAEAVEDGRAVLAYGLETCNAARGAEPDSPEARGWHGSGWERSAEIVRELMETLNAVSEEDRAPLVDALRELEACAPAAGPGGGGRAVA